MTRPLSDYRVPGTNIISFSAWSRDNIPKPPHQIPLGALVKVKIEETCERITDEIYTGLVAKATLIVVAHHKDCDGTALYELSAHPVIPPKTLYDRTKYRGFMPYLFHGYTERNLTPVPGVAPVELMTFDEWRRKMLGGE